MLIRFYQVPVLLTLPTKRLNLVRQLICLFVELIPHKKFPGKELSFLRNASEGSTVTRPGELALINAARGRFFDSQSKAESPNVENFEGGLDYSLQSFQHPHTEHLPDCLHFSDPPDPPTIKYAKPHEAIKLQFLTLI